MVDCVPEVDWNLSPSPPERTENETDRRQSHQHVVTEQKPVKEKDDEADGDEREKYSGNQCDEKGHYPRPKRNSRLRSREFAASALGTYASGPKINMQSRAEFDIITSLAEIAE